jgi:hypothetical protein
MEIGRDRLAAEFATFERQGNGVVIGAPGVGKTHLLANHFRAAVAANRPAFLLALDKHSVRNDVELQAELRLDRDLIDVLNDEARATVAEPGLLVIDSYDALRSEEAQRYVRTLIRRAKNVLQTRWRIIVAVRTFDASRSETLLELFPGRGGTPPSEFQMRGVHCRHFVVPTLSDDETNQAVTTIAGLHRFYERGSSEFRWLLHTPFNLWLAEKLLSGGVAPDALSEVSSEVQLLSLFWHQRVSTGHLSLQRRSVLTDVARGLVEARQLSLRLDAAYRREEDEIWRDLFSSEILALVGTTGQRVAFAHNILFDFAVSVLLIEDDPAQAGAFLAAEPSRPVFLRPSINYYFTRLWFENRDGFWAVAWFLLTSQQVHLRLFGRLIPMAVVVREARTVDDITPIFRSLEANEEQAPDAVLRLLQARRALKAGSDAMWLSAFERLITRPDRRFAWDLTVQTFDAVSGDAPQEVLESAGRIGRTILSSVWALRHQQPWADALGASWATRLVVRTFCTDPERSRALLRVILDSVGDKTLSVEYVRHIVSHVDVVWPCDPAFVAEIYERVLAHKETSTEATPMGTPVLPLMSNRRQDFDMCVYELNEHYSDFLAASDLHALSGGVRAIDRFVERDHVEPYINEGYTIDDLTERFRFGDRDALYVRDISESWRASSHQDEELRIADRVFQYVEQGAEAGDTRAVDLALQTLVQQARMAFWWGGLLAVAARHARLFAERLFPLCVAEPILSGSATIKQVTDFIAAAYSHWTPDQRETVERAVLSLGGDELDEQWRTRRRQRLLGLIPEELLATQAARDVRIAMARSGEQPTNEPLVKFNFSYGSFGETEWLREQGADPEKVSNKHVREVSAPLEAFDREWQNATPTPEAVTAVLPVIEESLRLLEQGGVDEPIVAMARTRIATTAMLAARTLKPNEPGFGLIRATLLDAARHPLVEGDEARNEDRDYPAWSSRPETEAAQGLPWIALRQPDRETLDTIEALVRNPDAIIRYLVVRELFRISEAATEQFWRLIDDRIANDTASIVRLAICESLARVAGRDQERVAGAARRLWTVLPQDRSKRSEFRDILLDIVIWLRLERGDAWARQALDALAQTPMGNPSLLHSAVFQLWHKAIPSRLAAHRATVEDVVAFMSTAVHQTCLVLRERDRANDERDAEPLKQLYGVIDESVAHVYFCLSRQHSRDGNATQEARRDFFGLVAPILDEILDFGLDRGFVLAPTVHHFMELLNEVVSFDARRAVVMAARAARAGEGANYNIDSLAIREVVQLVERVLADHRNEVQDAEPLQALMDLLDVFAATGWPEAIQLVWRLDDLFR